jgi:glycosyltransferase involved in cell wall biosynthesis
MTELRRPLRILLVSNHRRFKINFRAHPWARELAARGHDVDVMCHADTERFRTRVEHIDGFRLIENPDILVGPLRQGWDPVCAWRRRNFLFRENKAYDVIHCLDTRLAVIWPTLAYARAKGIPIVSDWIDWWGRGGLIDERRPAWYRLLFGGIETWFEEHYRNQLDGMTAISHALIDRAVGLGVPREHCLWIPGGANLAAFHTIPPKAESRAFLGLPEEVPVVCFSGLDVLIDLPMAVHAFEHLRASAPDSRLLLVGPSAADARAMLRETANLEHVLATGPVPYRDLPKYLAAADVFLMPYADKVSNVGRWPNKVGDYMCVGRPVISNPVGEAKWLYEHYDIGLLTPPTPEAMAEAALALVRDPARAAGYGQRAREVAESVFRWDRLIVELESWYYTRTAAMGNTHKGNRTVDGES